MDMRLEKEQQVVLPEPPAENVAFLFYVFSGKVQVNESISLAQGESVLIENESPLFNATETSDIMLFITKTDAVHFDGGMYSGNLQEQ
jgi:redox-sensitive bicupin YhaK (pirin superfamily)